MKKIACALVMLTGATAWARGGGEEMQHLLTVGAGIASPSVSSAIGENPAGITLNTRTKVLGDVASVGNRFDPMRVGATFLAGNGIVGGGVGLHTVTGDAATGNSLFLSAGLGAEITSMKMALGASVFKGLGGDMGSGVGADVGVLFNKYGTTKVGLTAFDVTGGVDTVGAGIGYDAGASATLVLDGTWNPSGGGVSLKPGLKIHLSSFQLSSGFGFDLASGGAGHLDKGLSLGLGFNAGDHVQLQAYFNQIAEYYAGLMFRI